ncbi:hypothetical protein KAH94_00915, partial [bacterium]|nr:hypothetical protein [bacterium]
MIKKNKTFLLLLIFTTFCVSAMKINNIKFFISYKKQLFEIQKNRLINFSPFILFLEEIDDLENPDEHKFYDTKEKAFIIPFDDAIGKTFSTNDIKNFETKNKNISKKPIYQQILLADRLQDKKWRKSCIQQLVKDITDNDFENFLKKKGILYDISTNFPNDIKNYLIKPALFEFDHTRFTIPLEKNEEISYVFPLSDNKIILINKTQKIFQVYDLKTKKFSNKTKKINNLNKVIKVRLPEYSNINKDDTSSIFQGPDYTIYQLVPNKIQFMPYKMMTFNFKKNLFEIEDFPEIIDEVKTISPNGNLILLQEIKKKRYFFYKYILFSLQRKKKITSFKTIHSRFHTYLYELNNKKIIYNDNKSLKTNEKNQSPKTIKTFNSNIEIFRKIDNKYYFIKTKKNEYFIFDVFTNKTILLSNIKGGSFLSLPNNKIVCGENISFIDLSTGNKNVFRKNKNNFYTDLKLLPNGKIIEIGYQSKFSSENKQGIFLWNIEKGATQRIFPKSSFAANPFVLPRGGLVTLTGDPIKNEPWSLNNIKLTIVPTH